MKIGSEMAPSEHSSNGHAENLEIVSRCGGLLCVRDSVAPYLLREHRRGALASARRGVWLLLAGQLSNKKSGA